MLINSGGRSRLRGNVLCPGEFYDYIGTHLVDGGWDVYKRQPQAGVITALYKDDDGHIVSGVEGEGVFKITSEGNITCLLYTSARCITKKTIIIEKWIHFS